jgi:hypothetical protein
MRNEKQIESVMYEADEAADSGGKWPSMTYEQGVAAALRWALGFTDDHPMEDE